MDESTPESTSGVHYVMTAAVLLDPNRRDEIRERALKLVGDRRRPFHWRVEGAQKRSAMIRLLGDCEACVFAVIHRPMDRKHQAQTRGRALTALASLVSAEGVTELLIESRDLQDDEDRRTLIRAMLAGTCSPAMQYDFAGKREPLLWLPDAVAGVLSEVECGKTDRWIAELQQAVSVIEVRRLDMREPRLPS